MLKLSWFEFIVRAIPEGFLFILAIHTFSKIKIDLKKYLLSGVVMCFMTYLIRSLPIQYGIHSLMSLVAIIITVININKIETIKAIRSGIITFILCFILEGINVALVQYVFKIDLSATMNDPILKTLIGMPSIIFLGIIVIIYYFILSKRKVLNYV